MPVAFDLDTYSRQAESFISAIDREYYQHFSGRQREFGIEAIYERHRGLFEREAVERLRELVEASSGDEHRRRIYLLELAVGGYLGQATKAQTAELAQREGTLEIEVGGRQAALPAGAHPGGERGRRRRPRRDRARAAGSARARVEPAPRRDHRKRARARARARLGQLPRDVRSAQGLRPVRTRAPDQRLREGHRRALRGHGRPIAGRAARLRLRRMAPLRPAALLPRARVRRPVPRRPAPAGPREDAWRAGDRPARAAPDHDRPRAAAAEVFAGVLRAGARSRRDLPGDADRRRPRGLRDAAARGRPHRALRQRRCGAAVRVPPPRRQLGDRELRLPVRASDRGPALGRGDARQRVPGGLPRLHARGQADLPAALRGQARLRAGASRRRRAAPRCRQRYSSGLGSGARRSSGRRRPTCRTSTRASTWPATCAPGRSRPAGGATCASSSASAGSPARGRRLPALALARGAAAAGRRAARANARRAARLRGDAGRRSRTLP